MAGARKIARERLDIDISDVSVSRTAIENFTWHHGGDPTAAESQIRSMLEDMLVGAGKAFRRTNGEIMLVAKGSFLLVVSPGGGVVRSYRTKHRDRTWAQVKAGVRSRVSRPKVRSTVQDEPAE
jgi:hypothetical protein